MTRFLKLFFAVVAGSLATACTTTPALHVIGVYEGQTPHGADDRPWWAKCGYGYDEEEQQLDAVPELSFSDCGDFDTLHPEKQIAVSVTDKSRPMVLALTAYERTLWVVSLQRGVKLTKVILAGYHSQRVSGIPPETPTETYTYDPSPCERCWQGKGNFYSYERPPGQLRDITGLEITSFQGRYSGTAFSIFPGIRKVE